MTSLKPGTRIELHGTPAMGGFGAVAPERATIARWCAISGPREDVPGYHAVKFSDGGKMLVHESQFRIIDNRA